MQYREIELLAREYKRLSKGRTDVQKYSWHSIVHHSTAMEGSTLTQAQVIDLLEYGKTNSRKPLADHLMVMDHAQALQFVLNEARTRKSITPQFIKQIAARVMKNTGGQVNTMLGTYYTDQGDFRLNTVWAGNRTFTDSKKVPGAVYSLCKKINSKMQAATTFEQKAAIAFQAQYELVTIHPFGDGNGRTSRLLMNFILAYFHLPISIIYKGSKLKYISTMEKARVNGDTGSYILFMFQQYARFLRSEIDQLNK